jgi:polar amino acid transport system substrate-binding protein
MRTRVHIYGLKLGLLAALLSLCACSISGGAPTGDSAGQEVPAKSEFTVAVDQAAAAAVPQKLRERGDITVATNPNTPPTTFFGEDNKTLQGREIDIITAVASRLGLRVSWQDSGGFDNLVPGLQNGRYDAAVANLTSTSERLKLIDFVTYFHGGRIALAAHPESGLRGKVTALDDLCGQTIGVGTGTTHAKLIEQQRDKCVAEGKQPIQVRVFPDRPSGVQAVASKQVAGFVGPFEGLRYQTTQASGSLELAAEFTTSVENVSVGLSKNSPMAEPIRLAIDSLIADGTYRKILDKWDLAYGSVDHAAFNEPSPGK